MAVMSGFEANLRSRILSLSPHIQIARYGGMTNYLEVQDGASRLKGVTGADAFIVGEAMLNSQTGAAGVVVRGIESSNPAALRDLRRYLQQGSLSSLSQPATPSPGAPPTAAIVVGASVADKLRIHLGDEVRVISPQISAASEVTAT